MPLPTDYRGQQMTSIQDEQTQNEIIRDTVQRERSRLSRFIRSRLPDPDVVEDVLQDVFYELTEAYRLTKPIERVASWLFAVARNKINDWYRKPRPISLDAPLNIVQSDGSRIGCSAQHAAFAQTIRRSAPPRATPGLVR